MKQVVRTSEGELTYGSMAEVKRLYEQGFISPDDEIRPEDSTRWTKCSNVRVLAQSENRGKTETGMGLRIAMGIAASVVLAGLVQHSHGLFLGGLVALAVAVTFFVYSRRTQRRVL